MRIKLDTKLETQQERDDCGAMSRQPGNAHDTHKSARPREASPSFAAFVADAQFAGDLCIALAGPLVMLSAIVRSVDPWVGEPRAWGGGAASLTAADPTADGAARQAPPHQTALDDFPFGSSVTMQVLHVVRHLPWYAVVAPSRLGDWAIVLHNTLNLSFTCTLLLLAACPRSGVVWAWWQRHRFLVVFTMNLMARCLPLLSTLLLLPPRAWPKHPLARFVVSASTSPLVFTLALCVFDLLAKVPLPATVIQALAQTAAIFIQAYRVAPTIVTRWREQQQPGTGRDDGPVPLQCGSPLRPEHSALLSCRPLALQVLLGLAMVAWPVGLAWAVDRRLRRQHAAVCREWVRQQRGRQQGQQQDVCRAPANTQQQQRLPACRGAVLRGNGHRGVHTGSVSGSAGKAPDASPRQQTPAEAPAAGPCPGTARGSGGPRPSARYRSRMSSAMVTIKVQEHPGDYNEYGNRLASVLQDCVREELWHSAAAGAVPDQQAAAPEPLLWTTVIRGCVQVVLWGWILDGLREGGAGAGGVGDGAGEEDLLQRLVPRLGQRMAQQEEAGSVRGVSVQVGQQVAVLGDPGQGVQPPGAGGGGSDSASVRLLLMSPPAASLAAIVEPAPLDIRFLLHSPVPQMARVLVLAEAQVAPGTDARPGEPRGGAVLHQRLTRARLLLELPVQLEGGVQEVEVQLALEAGELAGAATEVCKAGGAGGEEAAGAVGVLRVVMVGPEHGAMGTVGGQRQEAAGPRPLVHWVAPPLLLLPPAAAAEVCGAWEAMQREAGGGLTEMEEGGQQQQQQQQQQQHYQQQQEAGGWATGEEQQSGGVEHVLLGSSSGYTGTVISSVSGELLASAERRSSLWWSHMAPLLGDLAHALGGHQGQGQEGDGEAAGPVWLMLLPYLQGRGMAETLSLLGWRDPEHTGKQGYLWGAGNDRATTAAAAADSPPPDLEPPMQPSAGPALGPMLPTSSSGLGKASHQHQQHPSMCTGAHPAVPCAHPTEARTFPFPLLPRPFSPPALELCYQQWRLQRLAQMAPYALFFDAGVCLGMMLGALGPLPVPVPAAASDSGAGAAALPLLLRLAQTAVFGLLGTVSDVLGLAVVYMVVVLRPRRVLRRQRQQQQQLERQQERGRQGGARGAVDPGTTPAVLISPRDVVWYRLAACVAGPAALLLCAALINLGLARMDPRGTGTTRVVYGSGLIRAVIVPSLQQMSTWEAVAAAPLLWYGETLLLLQMQPAWGVWWAGAVVMLWRLVAVAVSAAWERRSRCRFVQGQQQQAEAAAVGDRQGSGAGEGLGGGKKRV